MALSNWLERSKKSSSILMPVILFIILDSVALGLNFWISAKLRESAVAINLSGRQRMLSQRMTKSLLVLNVSVDEDQKQAAFQEFASTVTIFSETLTGFLEGGMTISGDGNPLFLQPNREQTSRSITLTSAQLWTQILQRLAPVLENGRKVAASDLNLALNTMLTQNQALLKLMNDLTTTLEKNATQDIAYLRIIQACLLVMALLNFIFIFIRLSTQFKQAQNNILALQNIIDSIETGVILFDSHKRVHSGNKAASQLFGYGNQRLVGMHMSQLILADENRFQGVRKDNSRFSVKIDTQTLFELNHTINLCTITDISEHERKEQALIALAFHDYLTGLPNRNLLLERLNQELLHARRESTFLAILFIDLDGFKAVNDGMGHDAGDQLLQQVGKRFIKCCREVDTVARLGGDEFVFVLTSLHSTNTIKQIASHILKSINQPFIIDDQSVTIGTSIGIAVYPDDHYDAQTLIAFADKAMYAAKQKGKNQIAFASELHN